MRLGIYGGSFDPVHYGHLLLAECCREQAALDRILFVPAAQSPHKLDSDPTPPNVRCEMVKLAIGGHEAFETSTLEVDRGGVSYTIDTLKKIAEQRGDASLFLLMGADTLFDFPKWKSPHEICELCSLVVVERPGSAAVSFAALDGIAAPERIAEFERQVVHMPQIDISSTDLRQRVRGGRSIRFQMPRAVEEYIRATGVYRN